MTYNVFSGTLNPAQSTGLAEYPLRASGYSATRLKLYFMTYFYAPISTIVSGLL